MLELHLRRRCHVLEKALFVSASHIDLIPISELEVAIFLQCVPVLQGCVTFIVPSQTALIWKDVPTSHIVSPVHCIIEFTVIPFPIALSVRDSNYDHLCPTPLHPHFSR